jgi:predicted RNA binding protein YcfA (HicA-like mRNA interferase family)
MKPVSGRRMCRLLETKDWVLVRTRSSHHAFKKPGQPGIIIVPVRGNRDLKPGTQHDIMKAAGLQEADL